MIATLLIAAACCTNAVCPCVCHAHNVTNSVQRREAIAADIKRRRTALKEKRERQRMIMEAARRGTPKKKGGAK